MWERKTGNGIYVQIVRNKATARAINVEGRIYGLVSEGRRGGCRKSCPALNLSAGMKNSSLWDL